MLPRLISWLFAGSAVVAGYQLHATIVPIMYLYKQIILNCAQVGNMPVGFWGFYSLLRVRGVLPVAWFESCIP